MVDRFRGAAGDAAVVSDAMRDYGELVVDAVGEEVTLRALNPKGPKP